MLLSSYRKSPKFALMTVRNDDGLSQPNPSPVLEVVRLGQEAMSRINRHRAKNSAT